MWALTKKPQPGCGCGRTRKFRIKGDLLKDLKGIPDSQKTVASRDHSREKVKGSKFKKKKPKKTNHKKK